MFTMYSITVNVCAVILLLSSVITIVILLKKQFQQWKTTPLYILSVSDVLFSILTSCILFISCAKQITDTNRNKLNNTYPRIDNMWNENTDNEDQKIEVNRFIEHLNTITSEDEFNVILKCDYMSAIVKYGVLFLPFTNSFVSLLVFSIQCNLNVIKYKNWCFQLLCSEEKMYEDRTDTNKFNIEGQLDSTLELVKSKKLSIFKQNLNKILQVFKCNEMKESKKITAMFIVSQWVIPAFVTGLLYLPNYDNNYIKDLKNTKCLFENNFFVGECLGNMKPTKFVHSTNSKLNTTSQYNNYINGEDPTQELTLNSTKINEIISKIQNIVYSTINDQLVVPLNMTISNTSKPLDTEEYFELDTHTKLLGQNESVVSNVMENASLVMHQNSGRTSVANHTHIKSPAQLNNYVNGYRKAPLLFTNSKMNSANDIIEKENQDNEMIAIATKNPGNTDNFTNLIVKHTITNAQIYAEILKHIHNTSAHRTLQDYNNNNNNYNRKKPREFKLKADYQYNSTSDIQNELLNVEIIIYKYDNISKIIQVYVTDKCFVTVQFIKLHLLACAFLIYFLPILLASTLHQHGKLNCQIILEQLKANNKVQLNNTNSDSKNEINDIFCNISMDSDEPGTSKQDTKYLNEIIPKSTDLDKRQQVETQQDDYNECWNRYYKNNQRLDISINKEEIQLNIMGDMKNMLKLFDTVKISLLSGILLWTPLFLEFLVKVFTLLHVPGWLLNATYLAAIGFTVLRNIFNLKMIKLEEINTAIAKTNSIYPVT